MATTEIEEGHAFRPQFNADGLIPCVTVAAGDAAILMLAYMNEAALEKTLKTREMHYFSRSRQAIWRKGETSGHTQKLIELRVDCDQDALVAVVEQTGGLACHVGYRSCFYRRVDASDSDKLEFVMEKP